VVRLTECLRNLARIHGTVEGVRQHVLDTHSALRGSERSLRSLAGDKAGPPQRHHKSSQQMARIAVTKMMPKSQFLFARC
jgi:hypothetical protein